MHSRKEWLPSESIGRFYTNEATARFLTERLVDRQCRTVLDPSCGAGVFLAEAANRLQSVRPDECQALTGIDVDREACARATALMQHVAPRLQTRIINRDFFTVTPEGLGQVEVLLGNPPFVRYQELRGRIKKRALKRAAEAGVPLSRMSNAWAPFVIHGMSFLRDRGRMGLILPAELLHARYAAPVLRRILDSFERVRILIFDAPLFPSLSTHAIALIAEGAGSRCDDFRILRVRNRLHRKEWTTTERVVSSSFTAGKANRPPRVSEYCLPPALRDVFRKVSRSELVRPLGEIVSVDIGYVTGDHDFFHLTNEDARDWGIPREFCTKSLRNGRGARGAFFAPRDWDRMKKTGAPCYLFHVPPVIDRERFARIRPYIVEGKRRGVNAHYQCRIRDPWYSVKGVRVPDGFVTSMTATFPRLIANDTRVTASNSLHIVTRRPEVEEPTLRAIMASWYSSFTIVSAILEGHELGGGLRKLEPSDAERVSVITPPDLQTAKAVASLVPEIDKSLRQTNSEIVASELDRLILNDLAGLTPREADTLSRFARRCTARAPGRRFTVFSLQRA